jgi:6-phosphogluconolactonase (cycloisomerase 2 family)
MKDSKPLRSTNRTRRFRSGAGAPTALAGVSLLSFVGFAGIAGAAGAAELDGGHTAGAVYTATNSPSGNAIEAFSRAADGSLAPAGTFLTGGNGGPLGSGHSIAVSGDGEIVVAVNAGSNSISAFSAGRQGLDLIGTASSDGVDPNSVTISGDTVYVLDAGSKSIAGFRVDESGLRPIPGSIEALGAGAATPRQIQFADTGRVLVVDEGGSNTIDTFVVDDHGEAGPASTTASVGGGPFGFDFDRAGHLLVSDAALTAGQSGATSYDVTPSGSVIANGPAVPIEQAAACWLAAAGHYAFTANAGSGSIGGYSVAPDGTLTALGSTLVEGNPKSHPLDEGVSRSQHYLYVLADGVHELVGYRVGQDGSLTRVSSVPVTTGSGGIGVS